MSMELEGLDQLLEELEDVAFHGQASVEAVQNFAAQSTAQRAKHAIRHGHPAGRIYYRDNPPRVHQASAPGQPPAEDLGYLARSIRFTKFTGAAGATVSVNAPYAEDLEFGNSEIAPRPFLGPAFREAVAAAAKRFRADFESRL